MKKIIGAYFFLFFAVLLQASLPSSITVHLKNDKSVTISPEQLQKLAAISPTVNDIVSEETFSNELGLTDVDETSFNFILSVFPKLTKSEELVISFNNFRKFHSAAEFIQLGKVIRFLDISALQKIHEQFALTGFAPAIKIAERKAPRDVCFIPSRSAEKKTFVNYTLTIPAGGEARDVTLNIIENSVTLKNLSEFLGHKDPQQLPGGAEISLPNVTDAGWDLLFVLAKKTNLEITKLQHDLLSYDRKQLVELLSLANYLAMPLLLELVIYALADKVATPAFLTQVAKNPTLLFEMVDEIVPDLHSTLQEKIIANMLADKSALFGWAQKLTLTFAPEDWKTKGKIALGSIRTDIRAIAFNGDASQIAVAMASNSIAIFDVQTGKQVRVIEVPHFTSLKSLISGGSVLAADEWNGSEIVIFDWNTGKIIQTIVDPAGKLYNRVVTMSADGSRLAYENRHRHIIVVDTMSGKKLKEFTALTQSVVSLSFNSHGTQLAIKTSHLTLALWDVDKDTVSTYPQKVYQAVFNPRKEEIAVGLDNAHIGILNAADHNLQKTVTAYGQEIKGSMVVNSFVFNDAGTMLAYPFQDSSASYGIALWIPELALSSPHPIATGFDDKIMEFALNENVLAFFLMNSTSVIIWDDVTPYVAALTLEQALLVRLLIHLDKTKKGVEVPNGFKNLFASLPKPLQQRLIDKLGIRF